MSKRSAIAAGAFGARPSREQKADVTTTVARSIIDTEVQKRDAKTAKLRALRLAKEAEAEPAPAKPARKKAAKAE